MSRMPWWACRALLGCVLGSAAGSCEKASPATQVMVVIDAEPAVRERIRDVDISVRSGTGDASSWPVRHEASLTANGSQVMDAQASNAQASNAQAVRWPLEVALVPRDGDAARNYLVVARARGESGGVIAEVRALSGFVDGKSLRLPLVFDAQCLSRASLCDPSLTCRAGSCIDPTVAVSTLLPFDRNQRDLPSGGEGPGSAGASAGAMGAGEGGGGGSGTGGEDGPCGDGAAACPPAMNDPLACPEADCDGCPQGHLRTDDDACEPLLLGLALSSGELVPALNLQDTRYRSSLGLLTSSLTIMPRVAPGVRVEFNGQASSEVAFTMSDLPLGETSVLLRLDSEQGASRRYTITIERGGSQRAYIKASDTAAGDAFGFSLATDGDTLVAGAPLEDGPRGSATADSGAVYVLVREGVTYRHEAYLKASDAAAGAEFGRSVAMDGDTLVVGAPNSANDRGAAYVFERRDGAWREQTRLQLPTGGSNSVRFGAAVAVQGDLIAVGAPGDDTDGLDTGSAYLFEKRAGNWERIERVGARNPQLLGWFGSAVALDGERLAVGATGESLTVFPSGGVYVFARGATGFSMQTRVMIDNPGSADFFGDSIALEGDTLVVGALGAAGTGAVYVYRDIEGDFRLEQRLTASNPSVDAYFGLRVALRGDVLVTGAHEDDSGGMGISAEASGPSLTGSGAAYVFVRRGARWSQLALLKAAVPGAGDQFGHAVAITDDTVLIGAPGESSQATGVDGDATNDGARGAGAVYGLR